MEKDKIDRFIDVFKSACIKSSVSMKRHGCLTTWTTGWVQCFHHLLKGPTAGYDSNMKLDGRNKYVKKNIKDLMDRQQKRKDKRSRKTVIEL